MGSLADRKAKLKKEEEKKRKAPVDGDYAVKFVKWELGKSKAGDDMYTLTWKITKKGEYKNKELKFFYVPKFSFAFDNLTDFFENCGIDLDKCDDPSDKPEVFDECLDKIDDSGVVKANCTIKNIKDKKFPELTLSSIECNLQNPDYDDDDGEIDEVESP